MSTQIRLLASIGALVIGVVAVTVVLLLLRTTIG
jgi:hypothetical protein